jgi:AcrR family transcriptional regulator
MKRRRPSPQRAKPNTVRTADMGDEKRTRILHAARDLFLRYGVKRTSIDDVARAAGIAKGTVYLSFASKDALFANLAELMCKDILDRAEAAITTSAPLSERVVNFLDVVVGANSRLLAHSPHAAELIDSKQAFAAPVFADFHARVEDLLARSLRDEGVGNNEAPQMFIAAAHGVWRTGDIGEAAYRQRLSTLVQTLLAGLSRQGSMPQSCP